MKLKLYFNEIRLTYRHLKIKRVQSSHHIKVQNQFYHMLSITISINSNEYFDYLINLEKNVLFFERKKQEKSEHKLLYLYKILSMLLKQFRK